MVGIATSADSTKITVFGHGLTVAEPFELEPGITLSPSIPPLDLSTTVEGCATFADYAATLQGSEIASFGIEIEETSGPKPLIAKAWNALWLLHLLSVACRSPCLILHSVSNGTKPTYSAASRDPFVRPFNANVAATSDQLVWARAVHGGRAKSTKLTGGYGEASHILVTLLARCVEIGRVPTPAELDRLAVTTAVR